MNDNIQFREAVIDGFTQPQTSWKAPSVKYGISVAKLRITYKNWMKAPLTDAQPQGYQDIHLSLRLPGRPCSLILDQ